MTPAEAVALAQSALLKLHDAHLKAAREHEAFSPKSEANKRAAIKADEARTVLGDMLKEHRSRTRGKR